MIQDRQFHLKESESQSVSHKSRWHKFLEIMGWKTHDNKPTLSLEEEEFFEQGEANKNGDSRSDSLQFNMKNSKAHIEPVGEINSCNELIKFASTENGYSALADSELENNHYAEEIWEPTPTNETFSVDSKTDNTSREIDESRGETEKVNLAIPSLQLETDTSEDDDWWEPPATSEDDEEDLVEPPAISEDDEEDLVEPPATSEDDEEDLVEPPATSEDDEEDWVELPKTSGDGEEDLVEPPATSGDGEEDLGELPKTSEDDDWWEPLASSFSNRISKPAGFFQDDNGKISPLRVSSFAALIAAILLGGLIIGGNGTVARAELTYGLLAAAFGTKTVNKFSTSRV